MNAMERHRHRTLLGLTVLLALAGLAACTTAARARTVPVTLGQEESGLASWYGHPYHGRRTASGEVYDMARMTAAHRTFPFGTRVLVTSLETGRSVEVRINDRGPFADGRIIDVSYAAARVLGLVGPGVVRVRVRVIAVPGQPSGAARGDQVLLSTVSI
jgi:rare lipoprotein A